MNLGAYEPEVKASAQPSALVSLLGQAEESPLIRGYLLSLHRLSNPSPAGTALSEEVLEKPEVKTFAGTPPATFHNYSTSLGVSFELQPLSSASDAEPYGSTSRLVGIDIDNPEPNEDEAHDPKPAAMGRRKPDVKRPACFPGFPILLPLPPSSTLPADSPSSTTSRDGSRYFALRPSTTGKDLLLAFGEPSRKGGGSSGLGIWTEWAYPRSTVLPFAHALGDKGKVGWFVQWKGNAAVGPGAWDKGKQRKWGSLRLFWDPS